MKKVAFHTLGCKLNQYETEMMREQFERAGYSAVEFQSSADIYILNTCTVTEKTEKECRRLVRRVHRLNCEARIYVTGCYAQLRAAEISKVDGVTGVFGNTERAQVIRIISSLSRKNKSNTAISDISKQRTFKSVNLSRFADYTRAFLKIQDGCDLACSFCAITKARGPNRSRPLPEIVKEAKRFVDNGYREIVLTGVNIGSYGQDFQIESTLSDVLQALLKVENLGRIRFGTLDPLSLNEKFLEIAASNPKICAHFHISLQSGDNDILKAMHRPYRRELFIDRLERIIELMPPAGIGCDVMVGFPGETDLNFKNTFDLIDRLPFSYLHVFSYSGRPGTKAAEMPNQIPENAKCERSKTLRDLSQQKKSRFFQRFVGQSLEVMVENRHDRDGRLTGLTENYIRISFNGPDEFMNTLIPVKLVTAQKKQMIGDLSECYRPHNIILSGDRSFVPVLGIKHR